jgi:hypothetical protein
VVVVDVDSTAVVPVTVRMRRIYCPWSEWTEDEYIYYMAAEC